jgi:anti-anti-sigma factor
MDDVRVEIRPLPTGVVAKPIGELRLQCEVFEVELRRVLAGRPMLVIFDLSELSFASSIGMGLVVGCRRSVGHWGGTVRLAAAQPTVLDSFERARLLKILDHFPTVDQAVAAPL